MKHIAIAVTFMIGLALPSFAPVSAVPPPSPAEIERKPKVVLPENARQWFEEYQSSPNFRDFKAFAVETSGGSWGWAEGYYKPELAIDQALRECRNRAGQECMLYAVGNTVVSGMSPEQLIGVIEEYGLK